MKQIAGYILLAIIFLLPFLIGAMQVGVIDILICFGVFVGLVALIYLSFWMIT